MELKGATINILGDSITEGVGASCEANRYTDVFARLYGAMVNNYGVSGSRIANQRINTGERHEAHFCMRMEEMDLVRMRWLSLAVQTTTVTATRPLARLTIARRIRSTAHVII